MSRNYYIIPVFVPHEGCPHDCAFCNQHSITGNESEVDVKGLRAMIDDYLVSIKGAGNPDAVVEISFFGGTFTGIEKKKQEVFLSIAKEYKDSGKINNIRLSTRPDYIDEEILDNLKFYGVDIIELGAQSFHEEVLKGANRGHSAEDIFRASEAIKARGIKLGIQLMLGLPKADFSRDLFSAKETMKIKPDFVRLYPALVIKNTAMEQMFVRGEYSPYTLEQCIQITKSIFAFFEVNDIKVIRIGLQPTKEISSGSELVSGPFHPSIREHIEGSLINDMIEDAIIDLKEECVIRVNSREISKIYADGKKYFRELQRKVSGDIKVRVDDELERGVFMIECESVKKSVFFKDGLVDYLKNRGEIDE